MPPAFGITTGIAATTAEHSVRFSVVQENVIWE